jgi:hypothetical protein
MMQNPHEPSRDDQAYEDEHEEAVAEKANHFAGSVALGDCEYDGREDREGHGGGEMGDLKREDHCFFPMAMW